jgi:hypothetical protein
MALHYEPGVRIVVASILLPRRQAHFAINNKKINNEQNKHGYSYNTYPLLLLLRRSCSRDEARILRGVAAAPSENPSSSKTGTAAFLSPFSPEPDADNDGDGNILNLCAWPSDADCDFDPRLEPGDREPR